MCLRETIAGAIPRGNLLPDRGLEGLNFLCRDFPGFPWPLEAVIPGNPEPGAEIAAKPPLCLAARHALYDGLNVARPVLKPEILEGFATLGTEESALFGRGTFHQGLLL